MPDSARRIRRVGKLPFTIQYREDEWLPSVLSRCAEHTGLTRLDLLRHMQIDRVPLMERRNLGIGVADDVAENIATAFGWTPPQVHAATMRRYDGDAILLRDPFHVSIGPLWARGSGTRYCGRCQAENPGVFLTSWRLAWTTVCPKHGCLLFDSCRGCGNFVQEPAADRDTRFRAARCQNLVGETSTCEHPLADAWPAEPVAPDSPIGVATAGVTAAIGRKQARMTLDTLRSVGNALLKSGADTLIADLAGIDVDDFRSLYDRPRKVGKAGPADALPMAAVTAAAWQLWKGPEARMRPLIRRVTFAIPVTHVPKSPAYGPGGVEHLLGLWRTRNRSMERRILHALDSDLSPAQRVLWASPARAEVEESLAIATHAWAHPEHPELPYGAPNALGSGRPLPTHLWLNWVCPLDVGTRTNAATLERTFALVARFAGQRGLAEFTGQDDFDALRGQLRGSMLGDDVQREAILRQLCELGLFLAASPPPIDYERRRRLQWRNLLSGNEWDLLAAATDTPPVGRRRALQLRRYMYFRLTGGGPSDLPAPWQFDTSTDDVADFTRLTTTMTTGLRDAIDAYLTAYLRSNADESPVVWEPPRWRDASKVIGRELDDIDLSTLHALIDSGVTAHRDLARGVARTERHVRWALLSHPRPSKPAATVEWDRVLPDYTPCSLQRRLRVKQQR